MIAECPSCSCRYDVTGYPVGQQARCRCGTVFELQEVPTQVGRLACPQCGASVPEDCATCEHCQCALLVKACPRCYAHVFHGHKHCPKCGTEVGLAARPLDEAGVERDCPRCDTKLVPRLLSDVQVDECPACVGVFIDAVAIERIISERQQARAEAIVGAYSSVTRAPTVTARLYVKCPVCQAIMNRRMFARGAGVVIDICRLHGTWFDAGELPAVVEFVANGGLERAEKKAIAEAHDDLRSARQSARYSAIADSRLEQYADRSSSSLGDLFISLWK